MDDSYTIADPNSLSVSDLSPDVTEHKLLDLFGTVGAVASVGVRRNIETNESNGYASVKFYSFQDAMNATVKMNLYKDGDNAPWRVRYAVPQTIYVYQIQRMSTADIEKLFVKYGKILSIEIKLVAEVATIVFEDWMSAQIAVDKLNGLNIDGKMLLVTSNKLDRSVAPTVATKDQSGWKWSKIAIPDIATLKKMPEQEVYETCGEVIYKALGEYMAVKLPKIEHYTGKFTGMFLQLPHDELTDFCTNESTFLSRINEAISVLGLKPHENEN